MSESIGSNAEAEERICGSIRRLEEEPGDSAESMASSAKKFDEDETIIILNAAVDLVKRFPRNDHTQQVTDCECEVIVKKISEDYGSDICHEKVAETLEYFYWEFGTFCHQMVSQPDHIAKSFIKFCPEDGNIYPANPLYEKTSRALTNQYAHLIRHYALLKEIFTFTWLTYFGPHTSFKRDQESIPSTSSCDSCIDQMLSSFS